MGYKKIHYFSINKNSTLSVFFLVIINKIPDM